MQRVFVLSNTNQYFTTELTFTPSTIVVLNNTDQPVYFRIGSTLIPGTTVGSYDRKVLPVASGIPSNVALPNNSYQFSGYLPTTGTAGDTVTIIFQGTSDPFSNKVPFPFGAALPS